MGMARTKTGQVADETALLAVVASEATAAGWTVYGPVGTTPAGAYWFVSPGESGYLNIVGGFSPDPAGTRIFGHNAADIDTLGRVSANVGGYVNNDPAGVAAPVLSNTHQTTYAMNQRKVGTPYTYRMAVDLDSIRATVNYETTTGGSAQAVLYLGTMEAVGDDLEVQAMARVANVAAGVLSPTSVQITLDSDITAALKDTGAAPAPAYPDDPAQQRIFFQVVDDGTMPTADGFKGERALPIVPGSLTTIGGVTQFEIPLNTTPGQSKLFEQGSGQRYDALRGKDDLVRLHAQPTLTIVAGSSAGVLYPQFTRDQAIVSWDLFGGQRPGMDVDLVNIATYREDVLDPDTLTLGYSYWRIYGELKAGTASSVETSIIPQDEEGTKLFGATVGLILTANIGQSDGSLFAIDGDLNRRYCCMHRSAGIGIGPPANAETPDLCWAVGPGF